MQIFPQTPLRRVVTSILLVIIGISIYSLRDAIGYHYAYKTGTYTTFYQKNMGAFLKKYGTVFPFATTTIDTSNWKTFYSKEYGFTINVPRDWHIEYNPRDASFLKIAPSPDARPIISFSDNDRVSPPNSLFLEGIGYMMTKYKMRKYVEQLEKKKVDGENFLNPRFVRMTNGSVYHIYGHNIDNVDTPLKVGGFVVEFNGNNRNLSVWVKEDEKRANNIGAIKGIITSFQWLR